MHQVNRLSGNALIALSSVALLTVLVGVTMARVGPAQPPPEDEGTLAHIFQLTVVLAFFTGLVFVTSADWNAPARSARPLAISAAIMAFAFGLLYYGEHYLRL
jgi:hypothetical protein